jgi:hypothetical protein
MAFTGVLVKDRRCGCLTECKNGLKYRQTTVRHRHEKVIGLQAFPLSDKRKYGYAIDFASDRGAGHLSTCPPELASRTFENPLLTRHAAGQPSPPVAGEAVISRSRWQWAARWKLRMSPSMALRCMPMVWYHGHRLLWNASLFVRRGCASSCCSRHESDNIKECCDLRQDSWNRYIANQQSQHHSHSLSLILTFSIIKSLDHPSATHDQRPFGPRNFQ